jgi:hypothetical protein
MSSLKFEEQQRFRQTWVYIIYSLLVALLGLFLYADFEQIVFDRPFGDKPASNSVLLFVTLFLLALLVLAYQTKLETMITDDGVSFRWKPYQKTYRKYGWGEIEKVQIVNYGFVGYGWRLTPYGTIYNVAGDTGLQLHLKSGKKVVLGTQKPNELSRFLRQINHEAQ